ncbi:MAG: CocE/NonD family hydrolase [Caulobacteraceae bacterium]
MRIRKGRLSSGQIVRRLSVLLTVSMIGAPFNARAVESPDQVKLPPTAQIGDYVGQDVMIPMRDGVKLHAEIWRPKTAAGALPVLMQRSPYGFGMVRVGRSFGVEYSQLAKDGYIFVLEDIRGRFGSEGDFVMLRPTAPEGGVDESSDTYDTIAWLTKNLPSNNGAVGIFGVSYLGWTSAMSTIHPHPALKAISVQASPEDMFVGDDFHHNGAFRLDYGWEYAATLESDGRTMNAFSFGREDSYGWFLRQGPLADLDVKALGRRLPSWQNFVRHPNYDAFWRATVTSAAMPEKPSIPNLIVAGWWDQEDFYGPLKIFQKQSRHDTDGRDFLVIGPWYHGGWIKPGGDHYGPFDLGGDTGEFFRTQVEAPWFRYWLKGEGRLDTPKALVFETGSNQWRRYAAWPPRDGVVRKNLYFHAGGRLSFAPPGTSEGASHFISDPAHPVPYRARPISPVMAASGSWPLWQADDQAPFEKRKDVLSWRTDVLDEDVTLRGDIAAKLFASTTGTDADWIVKLVDVYPGDPSTPTELRGRELIIADDVFRGRFRSGFEHPKALTPGKVLDYSIDLHSASHVFKKGHMIEVQVQSTWFPLIDRNPQTFQANIFRTSPAAFKAQKHAVFHSATYPSSISVDVADATSGPG